MRYLIAIQSVIIVIILSFFLFGCGKDSNPVGGAGAGSISNGTLVYDRGNIIDSSWQGYSMHYEITDDYDFKNTDSVIITFKANIGNTHDSSGYQIYLYFDSSGYNICYFSLITIWKKGNYDYRFAFKSPNRKFYALVHKFKYQLNCWSNGDFICVRNLKIYKK